ncbi:MULTISPECIES: hypothetical protein [Luteibacter]|jgi:hypothetical protein|uniref:hypothetical protein n=1 Tax=Luteibacter sp. Lutesp34 TaxID=3243030 RepID=UPI0039B57F66
MNRFLDRLASLYAPLGRRGRLMDGHYRFAPDAPRRPGGRKAKTPNRLIPVVGAASAAMGARG